MDRKVGHQESKFVRHKFAIISFALAAVGTSLAMAYKSSIVTTSGLSGNGIVDLFKYPGYQIVKANEACESKSQIQRITTATNLSACEYYCTNDTRCEYYFWKDEFTSAGRYDCLTYSACDHLNAYPGGSTFRKLPTCVLPGLIAHPDKIRWVSRTNQGQMIHPCPIYRSTGITEFLLYVADRDCAGTPMVDSKGVKPEGNHESQARCQKACAGDAKCNFYVWKEEQGTKYPYHCAMYKECYALEAYHDGNGASVFIKKPKGSEAMQFTFWASQSYCNSTPHHRVVAGDAHPSSQNLAACAMSCEADPHCGYVLWKDDKKAPVSRECAHYTSCDSTIPYPHGEEVMIYKNNLFEMPDTSTPVATAHVTTVSVAAAPVTTVPVTTVPGTTAIPWEPPKTAPGSHVVVLVNATWEVTPSWDCRSCDLHQHQVRATPQETKVNCAKACLLDSRCVAWNYPNPGDGYCYIKGPTVDCHESSKQKISNQSSCGRATRHWDYYTLLTPRSQVQQFIGQLSHAS